MFLENKNYGSTIIKLAESFNNFYPELVINLTRLIKNFSVIKIQHEFDMLAGQMLDIKIEEGNRNDSLYLDYIIRR